MAACGLDPSQIRPDFQGDAATRHGVGAEIRQLVAELVVAIALRAMNAREGQAALPAGDSNSPWF
jgi:hypothetical protein